MFLWLTCVLVQVSCLALAVARVRRRGWNAHDLFAICAVLFVCFGMSALYLTQPHAGRGTALSVVTGGTLTYSVFGTLRRPPEPRAEPEEVLDARSVSGMLGVGWVLVGVSAAYFLLLGSLPLLDGLRSLLGGGGLRAVNTARISRDVYVNPDAVYIPLQGLLEGFRYFGLPLAFMWGTFIAVRYRRQQGYVLAVVAALTSVLAAQRWPLLYFLIPLVTYLPTIFDTSRVMRRRMIYAVVSLMLAVSAALGRDAQSSNPLAYLVSGATDLFQRVLLDQMVIPYQSYASSSALLVDQGGATYIQSLAALLPGPAVSYPVTFYQVVTRDQVGFTAAPDAFTEAYINFGPVGVVLFSALMSMALACADSHFGGKPVHTRLTWVMVATVLATTSFSGLMFCMAALIVAFISQCLLLAMRALGDPAVRGPKHRLPTTSPVQVEAERV